MPHRELLIQRTICLAAFAVTNMLLANAAMAHEPAGPNSVSATDFAPYYQALYAWHKEPVGRIAAAAFEQSDCGCATKNNCDCETCACERGCSECETRDCDCDECETRDCGCDECNTCAPCCCPPPAWHAWAGVMVLSREIDTLNFGAGPVDYDSTYDAGFEIGVRGEISGRQIEIRYFDVTGMRAARSSPVNPVDSDTYASRIRSGEINLFFGAESDTVRFTGGLRYIDYDEELNHRIPAPPFTLSRAENNLYGLQLGALVVLYQNDIVGSLNCHGFAKAGIYYGDTRAAVFGPQIGEDNAVFVGEAGLKAGYRVTSWLSIDASYEAMFLNGVALAGEQSVGPVLNHGDALLHGFTVGGTANW